MRMQNELIRNRVRLVSARLGTLLLVLLMLQSFNSHYDVHDTAPTATELSIEGTQFTINGTPTFLYGISYYGALGASEEFILHDLADMKKYGFNWIRVWANWNWYNYDVSAVDGTGYPRDVFFNKLKWLVAECDREGIIVDVTLHRTIDDAGPRLQTLDTHQRAVENIIKLLKPHRNWYLDLANERQIPDERFVSFDELKQLRETAKQMDSRLLVTASAGGDISFDDLPDYLQTANVDFLCPHRPRRAIAIEETEAKTLEYLSWMKEIGRIVPVHYQEPFRRGWRKNWEPEAGDFVADLFNAKSGGAAGWCFHNGNQKDQANEEPRRSFDMRKKRLFDQLDKDELEAIETIVKMLNK